MTPALLIAFAASCWSTAPTSWLVVEQDSPAAPPGSATMVQSVGIETLGGVFTPLLSEGCSLPCSSTEVFSTAADDQDAIKLFLFRGRGPRLVSDAMTLGEYEVVGIAPAPRGTPQIEITFEGRDRTLRLSARDMRTGAVYVMRRVSK